MKIRGFSICVYGVMFITFLCLSSQKASAQSSDFSPVRSLHVIEADNLGIKLSYPTTIFYDSTGDEIYITDASKGQIVLYASDYFPELAIGGGRGLRSIYSSYVKGRLIYLCVGRSENDPRGHIAIFNQAFLPESRIDFTGFRGAENFIPRKMVIGKSGLIYVVGINSSAVFVLDPEGNYLREISPLDEVLGVPEKAKIISLYCDNDGRLYFLSEELGRVFVYDAEETFLFKFGQKGGSSAKLSRPRGIAIDERNGHIYIVDFFRHAINVYSKTGDYLFEFGGRGTGRGWFNYPTDIAVDSMGHLLITDTFNHRVQVFEVSEQPSAMTVPINESNPEY